MSNISISNLHPTGSELFSGNENFMSEISENDFANIAGGGMDKTTCDFTVVIYTKLDPIGTVVMTPPVKLPPGC
jgi:hypothetical protein